MRCPAPNAFRLSLSTVRKGCWSTSFMALASNCIFPLFFFFVVNVWPLIAHAIFFVTFSRAFRWWRAFLCLKPIVSALAFSRVFRLFCRSTVLLLRPEVRFFHILFCRIYRWYITLFEGGLTRLQSRKLYRPYCSEETSMGWLRLNEHVSCFMASYNTRCDWSTWYFRKERQPHNYGLNYYIIHSSSKSHSSSKTANITWYKGCVVGCQAFGHTHPMSLCGGVFLCYHSYSP